MLFIFVLRTFISPLIWIAEINLLNDCIEIDY